MVNDPTLRGLLIDRQRILRELAPILRRVGPNRPDRAKLNAARRLRRLELRQDLRRCESAIVARVANLLGVPERRHLDQEVPLGR